ncbi:MAG: glycosyltransferase [Gammaproteobacteria bacterium]
MVTLISSVHIIGGRGPGGAEGFYCRLVQGLARSGSSVHAINPPQSEVGKRLDGAIPQAHVRMLGTWDLRARFRIGQIIRSLRPAIVQTYLGRATRLTHIPEPSGPIHIARLGGYYDLKSYRHARAWVGNTQGLCDYLVRQGLPAERVFYIGNFVDIPEERDAEDAAAPREALGIPREAYVVLSVGRLHPVKGIEVLLHALADPSASLHGLALYLVLVGEGPARKKLTALAGSLGLKQRVYFAGWQPDPSPYYSIADLVVSSSHHETLGNTILEAWAHRRPVVATATAGAGELIDHGATGYLTPVGDARALARGLAELVQNPMLAERLAETGYQEVRTRYSPEVIVAAYADLYAQLIEKSR